MPEAVKRRYDASRRREQARATRQAIMAAARARFLADGFHPTTMAAIAAEAGASTDTIYKTFGGKTGLLRAMCEDALAGDAPLPAEQRSDAMQRAEADPAAVLRGLGTLTSEVAPRIAPLLLVLAAAADSDPALGELCTEVETARLARMTQVATALAGRIGWSGRRSVAETADILWAYSSPELYRLLVVDRGWSAGRYGEFVGESLVHALLSQDG